jgi:beta-lactamase class A
MALTACGRTPALRSPDPSGVCDRLDELGPQYDPHVGLFATDIGTTRTLAHRDDDSFAQAVAAADRRGDRVGAALADRTGLSVRPIRSPDR